MRRQRARSARGRGGRLAAGRRRPRAHPRRWRPPPDQSRWLSTWRPAGPARATTGPRAWEACRRGRHSRRRRSSTRSRTGTERRGCTALPHASRAELRRRHARPSGRRETSCREKRNRTNYTKLIRDTHPLSDLETSDEKKEIAAFALKEREKIDSQTCESARVARLLHPSTRTSHTTDALAIGGCAWSMRFIIEV